MTKPLDTHPTDPAVIKEHRAGDVEQFLAVRKDWRDKF